SGAGDSRRQARGQVVRRSRGPHAAGGKGVLPRMTVLLRGIGLAVPPHTMSQEQAAELARTVICRTDQQQRVLTALYRKAGIENRHSVLPYTTALNWLPESPTGKQEDRPATLGPTTAERMRYFAEHA